MSENKIITLIGELVDEERAKQDLKWGVQNHSDEWWLAILMEEVGEVSKEVLECAFGPEHEAFEHEVNGIIELVQAAAVIRAWLECKIKNGLPPNALKILLNKNEEGK